MESDGTPQAGDEAQNDRYVLVDGKLVGTDGDEFGIAGVTDVEDISPQTLPHTAFTLGGRDADKFEMVRVDAAGNKVEDAAAGVSWRLRLKDGEAEADGHIYQVTLIFTDSGGSTTSQSFEIVQGGLHLIAATPGMADANNRYYSGAERGLLWEEYSPTQNVDADGAGAGTATMSYTGGAAATLTAQVGPAFIFEIVAQQDQPVTVEIEEGPIPAVILRVAIGTTPEILDAYLEALFRLEATAIDASVNAHADAIAAARVELAKVMTLTTAISFTVTAGSDDDPGTTADAPAASTTDADSITLQLADSTVSTKDAADGSSGWNAGDLGAVETPRKKAVSEWLTVEGGTITLADGTVITYEGGPLELFEDADSSGTIESAERPATTIYVSQDPDGDWTVKSIATAHIGNAPGTEATSGLQGVTHYVLATVADDGAVTRNLQPGVAGVEDRPEQSWTIGDEAAAPFDNIGSVDQDTARDTVVKRERGDFELAPQSDENDNGNYSLSGSTLTRTNDAPLPDADQAERPSETVELTRAITETLLHQHDFQGFKGVQADGDAATGTGADTRSFSFSARDGGDADNLVGDLEVGLPPERPAADTDYDDSVADSVSGGAAKAAKVAEDHPAALARMKELVSSERDTFSGEHAWLIGLRSGVNVGYPSDPEMFVFDLNFDPTSKGSHQDLDLFRMMIKSDSAPADAPLVEWSAATKSFLLSIPSGSGSEPTEGHGTRGAANAGGTTNNRFSYYRVEEAFKVDIEKGADSAILRNVDLRILLKPFTHPAAEIPDYTDADNPDTQTVIGRLKAQDGGTGQALDLTDARHYDPVANLGTGIDATFDELFAAFAAAPTAANKDALIAHIAGSTVLKAAITAKLTIALTAAGGSQTNRDALGVDPLAGYYGTGTGFAPSNAEQVDRVGASTADISTTVKAGTIYLTDGRRFDFDATSLTIPAEIDVDGIIDKPDMVVFVEAPATYGATGAAGLGTVRILSQADFDAIADKSDLYVIAKIAAADSKATHNDVGGTDVNAAEVLTYTRVTPVTRSFELKVKNVNDNGPEVTGVSGSGAAAGTDAVAALNAETGQWEITLTEEVDIGTARTSAQTVTVAAADADNIQGDNLRGPKSVTSADRPASETITYEAAATVGNDNDMVESVDGATGEITLSRGALDYENPDLRIEEGTGRKYYLIEVEVTSTSKLSQSGRDARGDDDGESGPGTDNVDSVTRTIRLYVAPANDAPTDIALSDGVETTEQPVDSSLLKLTYDTLLTADDAGFAAAYQAFRDAIGNFGDLGEADDAMLAAARAVEALLEAVTVPANPTASQETRLAAAQRAALAAEDAAAAKAAFVAAHAALADSWTTKQARLVVESGYDGADIEIGTVTVADTDTSQGQSHSFAIASDIVTVQTPGGESPSVEVDLAKLFEVRTDAESGVHTLHYIGGVDGLAALKAYFGSTFTLGITATDLAADDAPGGAIPGGKTVTKTVVIAYDALQVTTPEQAAKEGDEDVPRVPPVTLLSGQTRPGGG